MSSAQPTTQLEPKKQTHRSLSERTNVATDRIELIGEANRFVETMVMKMVVPTQNSFQVGELEDFESKAYREALRFLAFHFRSGCWAPSTIVTKTENEVSTERH